MAHLTSHMSYLAMELPGLVIILGTPSIKNGLVVHFHQLPLRAMAEMSKHSAQNSKRSLGHLYESLLKKVII